MVGNCPTVIARVVTWVDTELLHEIQRELVHRVEVFTESGRRRTWTPRAARHRDR
jgi:hypothetical protein